MNLNAIWLKSDESLEPFNCPADLGHTLLQLLGMLDICSKEYWVRQYDHEVQGGSVIKPLCGAENDGPSDASVVRPILESMKGVAVSHGICPKYSDIDTYHMTACAVDEAMRNLVAVGADPSKVAALDNFCWCDPVESETNPDGAYKLAQLVRSARALKDVCTAYGMPLVSGKDSMKNDYSIGDTKISIPPTLLVTAIGQLEDVSFAVTMDAKKAGDIIYIVGETYADLGATHYLELLNVKGGSVPKLRNPEKTMQSYKWLHRAIKSKLVASCHDLSDGGLAVAIAETGFAGNLGMMVDLGKVPVVQVENDDAILFSETPGRLLVTVPPAAEEAFKIIMGDAAAKIGFVSEDLTISVTGIHKHTIIDEDIFKLKAAWQAPLGFKEVH
jgi:phosphoribosylformylglycinamidine synthase